MLASHHTPLHSIPFEHSQLFDTTDLDEARYLCTPILNEPQLTLGKAHQKPRIVMDHVRVGSLSISRLTTSATLNVDPGRLDSYYALIVPVRGSARLEVGRDRTDVAPGCAAIVSAMPKFRFQAGDDFQQIVIRIDRRAIHDAWTCLSGQAPSQPIDFACMLPMTGRTWAALLPTLGMLSSCARGSFDQLSLHSVTARLQDWLVTSLLLTQPHSSALPRESGTAVVPKYQRLAESYMEAHIAEPIGVMDVARASGISARALQASFHKAYGCGPMQWLRRRRLDAVHAQLQSSESERPGIAEIALRYGFAHLGEFSRAYRAAFDETPSQTLKRRA